MNGRHRPYHTSSIGRGHGRRRQPAQSQQRRRQRQKLVGTWCAQIGDASYTWSAYGDWREGDNAVLRGQPEEEVTEVFRGATMSDRYPNMPLEPLTEERRNQCILCGAPELHQRTQTECYTALAKWRYATLHSRRNGVSRWKTFFG